MTSRVAQKLDAALCGTPLAERLPRAAAPFLERRSAELERLAIPPELARGLARVLASSAEVARYLSLRPELVAGLGAPGAALLGARAAALPARAPPNAQSDPEGFLDDLRLLRRDETALAACVDLGALAPFEEVSVYLSQVAELVLECALAAARDALPGAADLDFAVLALGKLAGRELTYHSDLDLIFLYGGDTDQAQLASRLAQRMIHHLSTSTGAGSAYAIDARLRPSGRQGSLVSSYEAYRSYQLQQAQTWEHLALMRCRAVAGNVVRARSLLEEVQRSVLARRESPWAVIAELRTRIASERARERESRIAIKAGAGGIMDVDFLATGARLECGRDRVAPALPAIPDLLESVTKEGGVLLSGYRFLRTLEARIRWVAGRPVEVLETGSDALPIVAELVEPGLDAARLLERTAEMRRRVQAGFERVLGAGTIRAL